MNAKALKILEYDKIVSLLEECATSAPGRRLCRELLPYVDPDAVRGALEETTDAAAQKTFCAGI